MSQENVEKLRASLASWDGEMMRPEARPFEEALPVDAPYRERSRSSMRRIFPVRVLGSSAVNSMIRGYA
jgi:hypothetical protein